MPPAKSTPRGGPVVDPHRPYARNLTVSDRRPSGHKHNNRHTHASGKALPARRADIGHGLAPAPQTLSTPHSPPHVKLFSTNVSANATTSHLGSSFPLSRFCPAHSTTQNTAPDEDLPPIQYIPRDKPLLAASDDAYAKDLVRQSVVMMQEIWMMQADPPLPHGVYLHGHLPPPPAPPPTHHQPPQLPPATVAAIAAIDAQQVLTPATVSMGSPTSPSESSDDGSDDGSDISAPTHHAPPPPAPHHNMPAPGGAFTTTQMGVAQQAATFANNLLFFVHEVVRRSRTTCATLEVAMCYIATVRYDVRMILCDREVINRQARASNCSPMQLDYKRTYNSPLHDARRSFLAALVLASKFQQDRAFSNKAWSKLSGLQATEVTRCERALGDALQWRLWVGRDVVIGPTAVSSGASAPVPPLLQVPGPLAGVPAIRVPGIMGSGRCLSPPTLGVSVDMLEEELYQEEVLLAGIHSAHGPNGTPGEADPVAQRFIAAAHSAYTQLHHPRTSKKPMRRTTTEPSFDVAPIASGSGSRPPIRSQSLHDLAPGPFLPTFAQHPPLPGAYAGPSSWNDCEGMETLAEDDNAFLADWLVDEDDSSPCKAGPSTSDLPVADASSFSGHPDGVMGHDTPETPRAWPAAETEDDDDDIPMPPAPHMGESVLPVSSVVGAFRRPRTPIPMTVIPPSANSAGWFPPPHFITKLAAYTPPTEYQLLPPPEMVSAPPTIVGRTPASLPPLPPPPPPMNMLDLGADSFGNEDPYARLDASSSFRYELSPYWGPTSFSSAITA